MYDQVLLPTDGSEAAETALEHAVGMADRNDATLHCVHAVELGQFSESLDEETYDQTAKRLKSAGETAVDALVSSADDAGIATHSSIIEGSADDVILDYASENDIDVVVMATRGRTGEARKVMGSVTERVIRACNVPVLTVNVGE
jgi:nucleotide-binding universal stress UspA family protein